MTNEFWNITEMKVEKAPEGTPNTLENMEYITVSEHHSDDEQLREQFPYELPQDRHHILCGQKTLYKNPKTNEDWNQHYLKKSKVASEIAEEYFKKASLYKKQAKDALKSNSNQK